MNITQVTVAAFSPTGGSLACAETIAAALDPNFASLDLTRPQVRQQIQRFGSQELVILAAPVYAGRLPVLPSGSIFGGLQGEQTPAILLVSYGDRNYDDALLELYDLAGSLGFCPIGAAACVAKHTFSRKMGAGRPNAADKARLTSFAGKMAQKLRQDQLTLEEPYGVRPYKKPMSMPFAPKGDSRCNRCGACVALCPVGAISSQDPAQTDKTKCIDCFACVGGCPQHARRVTFPLFRPMIAFLEYQNRKSKVNDFFE